MVKIEKHRGKERKVTCGNIPQIGTQHGHFKNNFKMAFDNVYG